MRHLLGAFAIAFAMVCTGSIQHAGAMTAGLSAVLPLAVMAEPIACGSAIDRCRHGTYWLCRSGDRRSCGCTACRGR